MTYEKVTYLKRKPYYSLFERSFETGRIFAMEGSRPVLVEVMLFQGRSTKTCLEPFMAKIRPFSKLLEIVSETITILIEFFPVNIFLGWNSFMGHWLWYGKCAWSLCRCFKI